MERSFETTNQKDGTTLIEVFQRPLGWREEPKETLASEGRFLVLAEKYLDPYVFRRGKKITVAGEIQGEKIKPLGEMDYRYPIHLEQTDHLWEDYYYSPYPYYYYPGAITTLVVGLSLRAVGIRLSLSPPPLALSLLTEPLQERRLWLPSSCELTHGILYRTDVHISYP